MEVKEPFWRRLKRHLGGFLALSILLAILSTFAFGLSKYVPGLGVVQTWMTWFAATYLGAFSFACMLAGLAIAYLVSAFPEFTILGLKRQNPLHYAASKAEKQEFERHRSEWEKEKRALIERAVTAETHLSDLRRGWDQEKRELLKRAGTVEKDRSKLQKKSAAGRQVQEDLRKKLDVYEFALDRFKHQDYIVEKLLEAYLLDDDEFDSVFHESMRWLTGVTKKLVLRHDRMLGCTVLGYNAKTDTSRILFEDETKLYPDQFLPRRGLGIAGRVIARGEAEVIPKVRIDPDYVPFAKDNPESLLCAPVHSSGQVVGIVSVSSAETDTFSQYDLKTTQLAIDHIAVALTLRRLRQTDKRQLAISNKLDSFLFRHTERW